MRDVARTCWQLWSIIVVDTLTDGFTLNSQIVHFDLDSNGAELFG